MLIIPKLNLIFVHIPKTGGKSFSRCVQSYYEDKFSTKVGNSLIKYDLLSKKERYPHMTANEIKNVVGNKFYKRAKKVAFFRNPYSRLVSLHFYGVENIKDYRFKSFEKYKTYLKKKHNGNKVKKEVSKDKNNIRFFTKPQSFYLDDKVDIIKDMETLSNKWGEFTEELGIELPDLPHANKSSHKQHMNYYTKEDLRFFRQYFEEDFRILFDIISNV